MSLSKTPNGRSHYSTSSKQDTKSITDSKADLVSMEMESGGNMHGGRPNQPTFTNSAWHRRSRLEKILMVSLGLTFVILIISWACTITKIFEEMHKSDSVCMTPGCIRAAHSLIQNMDSKVDPCEDFYDYACGGFVKKIRIPDDESSRTQFAIIDDLLEEQLRDILESNATENESRVFKLARDQYQACMDLDHIERVGLEPLKNILKEFGGWPVLEDNWSEESFEWDSTNYLFRRHGFSPGKFHIQARKTIYFDQAQLGMNREYLIKGLEDNDVKNYFNFMQKVAVLLGADPTRAHDELLASLMFEIRLANASMPREERRNATKLYHAMKLHEIEEISPIVNWTSYVKNIVTDELGLEITPEERVIVIAPGFLKNLSIILKDEPIRNVANYMMWRAAKASIGFLSKAAREVIEEYTRNATGRLATTPRWKVCVGSAASSFAAAVGRLYVSSYFKQEAKVAMLEMVADIRDEFKNIINEIAWMDPKTKERAREKLHSIKEYIAYVDEIMVDSNLEELYKGLVINNTHYFHNGINMSIWSTNYHWKKLRETVDKTDWKRHANPAIVNAFYSALENSIQFPAGILQGLFFDNDRPQYLNYGGIGWVIGHEITHGFDDQGRQYDHEGNLRNWWEPETMDRFLDKTRCIVWQYGNYSVPELNVSLNGINTQGENIADNGGIKEAYKAYNRWIARHGEERTLPGLELNQKQLFWLGAANTWCSKFRPKVLEKRIRTGVHSPGKFRVIGPFSNSPDFARDFNCQPGSNMNPINKCEVW